MSSRREVFIRILELLQRKTLIETDLTAQESPPPGICHPRQKDTNARGSAGGGGELGAPGID